ncbi:MAG TPA: hypothetical protein VF824_17465 [Thermoanaerobaculia bacterium]|jgi:hypothetical protein
MPYKVQFVGLVCFLRESGGRRVLLPDGRDPGVGIDPHYASIIVAPEAVEETAGWNGSVTTPGVFPLPPCWLAFEGLDSTGAFDGAAHYGVVPELRAIDPNFEIDPNTADTIAQLQIKRGTLSAYRIPGGDALISQLDVPHDGSISVTVTPRDGSAPRTMRFAPGTEIALANIAGDDIYTSEAEPHGHFRIYERLSVRPVSLTPPATLPSAPASQSQHRLFMRAEPIGLSYDCSNTGCC